LQVVWGERESSCERESNGGGGHDREGAGRRNRQCFLAGALKKIPNCYFIGDEFTECTVLFFGQASQRALSEHATYCATKGALDMLSKVMALELGKHKVPK